MPAHLEVRAPGEFAIQGELDFDSVAVLWRETLRQFREQSSLHIDLAGVTRSNSAGVALLVEWLRQARARGQDLQFVNIPPQMLAIIRIADLDQLLPLA